MADLAAVEEDRLMKLWQGLGYYNRARNLQKAARQVAEDFGGAFPDTYEGLLTLSGVGEYTAGAIASIAFGVPVPAVDGNVLRVVARISGDGGDIARPDTKARMRAALQAVLPVDAPGDFIGVVKKRNFCNDGLVAIRHIVGIFHTCDRFCLKFLDESACLPTSQWITEITDKQA